MRNHFDSGQIQINQDLSPVAGYDMKLENDNYLPAEASLKKKRMQPNFSENQLNRKAARRYGKDGMRATPEKLSEDGMLKHR